MKKQIELLAPAGSFEIFKAVISAGADAVYVGGALFGARAYANNFSKEELLEAIDYAHLHGCKLYLTVNTLLKERELEEQLYTYLLPYYEQGLDGVIVQDIGAMAFIRTHFPNMEIHTSTQMTVTNRYGAELMKELGASRVVTARELSFAEVRDISEHVEVEIESFVHGALCYCYSGQCLLSSVIGGRSGNRGRCAQPCRLPYEALKEDGKRMSNPKTPYILSPKDLCTIKILPQLVQAGIYSFKIEGRMKQVEYAAGVVSIYRKYIDLYLEKGEAGYRVTEEDYQRLLDLGNRSGFTEGYYKQYNGADMITFEQPSHKKGNEALQEEIRKDYVQTERKEKIKGILNLSKDFPAKMTVVYQDITVTITGDIVQGALKQPLSYEKIAENMKKTGNTAFEFEDLQIEMTEAIFMPMKSLNQLRRDALDELTEELLEKYRRKNPLEVRKETEVVEKLGCVQLITASIEDRKQLTVLLENDMVNSIYLDSACYTRERLINDLKTDVEMIKKAGKKKYYILPAVFRKHTSDFYQAIAKDLQSLALDGIVVKNYDALQFVRTYLSDMEMIFDHNLYSFNNQAVKALEQFLPVRITAPLELNKKELVQRHNEESEILLYGRLPLMTSAQCIKRSTDGCKKHTGISFLKDRYNIQFPVRNCCEECYNVIYNSVPLVLFGQITELKKMGFGTYRLAFTTESDVEMRQILLACAKAFAQCAEAFAQETKNKKTSYKGDITGGNYTTGHYKRGVE